MILDKLFRSNFFFLTLILTLFSCDNSNNVKINGFTMGSTYEITIRNFEGSSEKIKIEFDSLLTEINNVFSTYQNSSEISKINNLKKNQIDISDRFNYVLNKSLYYCDLSGGTYDITIGPLVELWGFGKSKSIGIPSKETIDNHIKNIGFFNIYIKDKTLYKNINDISIDLNSIAKGYAVDEIALLIESKGYSDFLVEIGGEIKSSIKNSNNWIVGIHDPSSNSIYQNGVIKKILLNNKSMATSGTYNNYFLHNGKKLSHIINPKTGYPFNYSTVSATVIASDCIDADAFATMAMTMEVDEFLSIINNQEDVEALLFIIGDNNELIYYESENFKEFIY